jgi:hypothetical protein
MSKKTPINTNSNIEQKTEQEKRQLKDEIKKINNYQKEDKEIENIKG